MLLRSRLTRSCAAVVSTVALAGCARDLPDPSSSPTATPSGPSGSRSSTSTPPAHVPSERRWRSDVHRAMTGWRGYLDRREQAARGDAARARLAVNLDIDNTSIATFYDYPAAVPDVLSLARDAHRRGFAVLVNTARTQGSALGRQARRQLTEAGYPVTEICLRRDGERTVVSKQRCRRHFRDEGYTLVANVGNNDTDFAGGGFERAFRLPDYGRRLS